MDIFKESSILLKIFFCVHFSQKSKMVMKPVGLREKLTSKKKLEA